MCVTSGAWWLHTTMICICIAYNIYILKAPLGLSRGMGVNCSPFRLKLGVKAFFPAPEFLLLMCISTGIYSNVHLWKSHFSCSRNLKKKKKNLHSQVKILSKKVAIIFFFKSIWMKQVGIKEQTSWFCCFMQVICLWIVSKLNYEVIQM